MFPQVKSQLNVFPVLIAFSLSVPGSCPLSACRQCLQLCWAWKKLLISRNVFLKLFFVHLRSSLCDRARPSSAAQTQHKDFNDPLRDLVFFTSGSVPQRVFRKLLKN